MNTEFEKDCKEGIYMGKPKPLDLNLVSCLTSLRPRDAAAASSPSTSSRAATAANNGNRDDAHLSHRVLACSALQADVQRRDNAADECRITTTAGSSTGPVHGMTVFGLPGTGARLRRSASCPDFMAAVWTSSTAGSWQGAGTSHRRSQLPAALLCCAMTGAAAAAATAAAAAAAAATAQPSAAAARCVSVGHKRSRADFADSPANTCEPGDSQLGELMQQLARENQQLGAELESVGQDNRAILTQLQEMAFSLERSGEQHNLLMQEQRDARRELLLLQLAALAKCR